MGSVEDPQLVYEKGINYRRSEHFLKKGKKKKQKTKKPKSITSVATALATKQTSRKFIIVIATLFWNLIWETGIYN
jgi:hypothetical protein